MEAGGKTDAAALAAAAAPEVSPLPFLPTSTFLPLFSLPWASLVCAEMVAGAIPSKVLLALVALGTITRPPLAAGTGINCR